jgi:hypothetical protein
VLTLIFRSAGSAPDSIIEPPQLAFGAGIHIPHPAYDNVRLIVEIKAVTNQLFDVDLGRALAAALAGAAPSLTATTWTTTLASPLTATIVTTAFASASFTSARAATAPSILSRWTVFTAATFFGFFFFNFCHFVTLRE